MRKFWIVLAGALGTLAAALWAAPSASAAPFGAKASPVLADIYVGFGYGHCHGRRSYVRYYGGPRYYYAPRYYYGPRYVRPYYRYYPRTRRYYPRYGARFGYRGHVHGTRRVIGRRR
jgi:hypothetical protein